MLLSVSCAVVRAIRRAVDADMAERLESVQGRLDEAGRLLAVLQREVFDAQQREAQAIARLVLCEVELEAAEAECRRLETEIDPR
jgi:hypothetical protein